MDDNKNVTISALPARKRMTWLAGRLTAHGVPLAGRVRLRLQLEVLGEAAG